MKLLLDRWGVQANQRNETNGDTPFSAAARAGHDKVVKLLQGIKGLQVNHTDNNGSTPLHETSFNGHEKVVALLLENRNIQAANKANKNGNTPLYATAQEGQVKVKAKTFLEISLRRLFYSCRVYIMYVCNRKHINA